MDNLAPICLFTYNRLKETKQVIKALQNNFLASKSDLYIFSDGSKSGNLIQEQKIKKLREYLFTVKGFKSITIYESPINKGLAKSIIDGVSEVIKIKGKVIVLEDDLICSPNFLNFMNQSLDFYQNHNKVFSISGYSFNLPSLKHEKRDFYFGLRASSWGWGTWEDKWREVDWEVNDYNKFKWNIFKQFKFMKGGSDLPYMLRKQMNNKIDSWAIRWCYFQFKKEMFTVFPVKSKIVSIGFGKDATHTKNTKRFENDLDDGKQTVFSFHKELVRNKTLEKEFKLKFSIISRIKNKFS